MKELEHQPEPVGDGTVVHDRVIELMEGRVTQQLERYGTKLRINNGRDALLDALQEAIDTVYYLTQALMERENKETNTCEHKYRTGVGGWMICNKCGERV